MDVLHITDSQSLAYLGVTRPSGVLISLPFAGEDSPEDLLEHVRRAQPGLPVAFFRENGPAQEAIRLLRLGADEYFDDAGSAAGWEPSVERARSYDEPWRAFLVGDSPVMQ